MALTELARIPRSRLLTAGALAGAILFGGAAVVYGQTVAPTPRAGGPLGAAQRCPMLNGQAPGAFGLGMPGLMGGASDAVLKKLGLTTDQVLKERQAGKSLAQIAQERGVDRATLVATILDAHQTFLAERVKAGALTQTQADAMQAQMKDRVSWMVDQTGFGPGMMGAGRGGMMGGGFGGMMGRGGAGGMMGRGFGPGQAR